ncbi:LamG domain-containing protein [Georgenia sp. EYE_87]|uniref:LamG domain-containing protein n=1 Tax=Georgenia sp. EYE_87 TaxID=2853448 RepID=UPI0020064E0B|nr:LamG domain-containing protein [Georgenia sp. EYE_87]MCK6211738.1 LamG domain-containing protein [Georgenia sp. EYE_87]
MSETLLTHRSRRALPALAAMALGATIVVLPVSGAAAATDEGLVGGWRMDEGSGSAVVDSVGDNDGTIQGSVARIPGHRGSGALDFTGGRVTIPDSPELDLTGPMSVAAWVNPDAFATESIVKKAVQGVTGGYELSLSNNDVAFFRLNQQTNQNTFRVDSSATPGAVTAVTPGQWNHLVGVYDGTSMTLYVNGNARPSITGPAEVATNDLPLTIGAQSDSSGSTPFNGAVDSVHIYDRALTPAEITELMNADPAFEPVEEDVEVAPADVTFDDRAGTGSDTYTIPTRTGVEYLVSGAVKAAGTHEGSGTVTVTARALDGYTFAAGAKTTWTHTFSTSTGPSAPGPGTPTEQRYGFFLNDSWSSKANHVFVYGKFTDEVLMGDWDGKGGDTITVRRGNMFYVSNAQRGGQAEKVIAYGKTGDVVLVGDWDGDGVDTFAVRRGNAYHIKNTISGGPADQVVHYGKAGDDVVVGDWDGDSKDTLAVRRGNTYYVKNSVSGGVADRVIAYGRATDTVLAGDWDGKNGDTFAVRRGNVYHVKNSISGGAADLVQSFGRVDDEVYVGDWDGNGTDTLGVRRVP